MFSAQQHAAHYSRGLNVDTICVCSPCVCVDVRARARERQQMLVQWRNPTSPGKSVWEMLLKERQREREKGGMEEVSFGLMPSNSVLGMVLCNSSSEI